jgi:hypothetical protein
MTRPADVRIREDARSGTCFEQYVVGERTGPLRFVLEPAFVDEYIDATGIDATLHRVDGRAAAPPLVLALFLMGTLHQRYPPLPGTVMVELTLECLAPIWRDQPTRIVSEGEILAKAQRRDRRFVTWRADFRRDDGELLARLTNTFIVPEAA